jgi:hypothetical protein
MRVIAFRREVGAEPKGLWRAEELRQFTGCLADKSVAGSIGSWAVDATEDGWPQLYVLGPAPDHDCILSVSRLGRLYIVEDGGGQVLLEHDSLLRVAERIRAALRRRRAGMAARIAVAWCAVQEFFEEKREPVIAESGEIVAHVAPQFAALV